MTRKERKSDRKGLKIAINVVLVSILCVSLFFVFNPPQKLLLENQKKNYVVTSNSSVDKNNTTEQVELPQTPDELPEFDEPTIENLLAVQNKPKNISGFIVIPSAAIKLPIVQGIGGDNMLYGAGEQYSRVDVVAGGPGNYVLASHLTPWKNTLFTNLLQTKVGDEIYVSDEQFVYEYEVTHVEEVQPNDARHIQQFDENGAEITDSLITLYTCSDIDATKRYIVRGHLSKSTPNSDISPELRSAFEDWHTALGT